MEDELPPTPHPHALQVVAMIKELLETRIRPAVQASARGWHGAAAAAAASAGPRGRGGCCATEFQP